MISRIASSDQKIGDGQNNFLQVSQWVDSFDTLFLEVCDSKENHA
jgi:hypothetical protein